MVSLGIVRLFKQHLDVPLYGYIFPYMSTRVKFIMSNTHIKLGSRIRKILEDSSVSQRELARRLGVGPNQVSRWVLGTVAPTYTVLNDILKICRKTTEAGWLLSGKGESENHHGDDSSNETEEAKMKQLLEAKDKIIQLLERENKLLKEELELKKPTPLTRRKQG
jgi:transcriptional regulator with XRE-family HTH domain